MHILGKVLAFFVVIAAIVACIFTSKLIQVRNSWTAKTVTSKNKFEETQPKVEKLEAQIDGLKNELFRSRELWGVFWNGVQTVVANQQDGSLQIGIGTDQGIRDKQLLHGFEMTGDGATIYRGSFLVSGVQNASATLKPNWRATPDEIGKWGQQGTWRWRNVVPSGYQDNVERQLLTMLKHEETLKARRAALAGQEELLKKANATLKLREAELVGGDVLAKSPNVEPEFREGLVSAIEKAEEERNHILIENDKLRHKLREVQADIEQLQVENVELVNRLPEPTRRNEVTQKTK